MIGGRGDGGCFRSVPLLPRHRRTLTVVVLAINDQFFHNIIRSGLALGLTNVAVRESWAYYWQTVDVDIQTTFRRLPLGNTTSCGIMPVRLWAGSV